MSKNSQRHYPIQIAISTLFVLIIVVLGVVLSVQNYNKTSDIILSSADNLYQQVGQYVGTSERHSLWQGLLKSMDAEASNESARICLYQYYDLTDAKAKTFCSN